jgi:hypothetical protein
MTGEITTFTGVSAAAFADSGSTITAGSDTITLWAAASSVASTGLISASLTITEEPDTLTAAGTITAAGHTSDIQEPPWLAEFLLGIFARTTRAKDIDALWGDFQEYLARDRASGMSRRRVVARYLARVLRSLWPQVWHWIKRVGWAGLIAAVLKR